MVVVWNEPKPQDLAPDAPAVANTNWLDVWKFSAGGQARGLDRGQRDRVAEVAGDHTAQQVLDLLDHNTSIRWGDLAEQTGLVWPDVCRSVAFLTRAGICEPGPKRVRLSELGAILLAESTPSQ